MEIIITIIASIAIGICIGYRMRTPTYRRWKWSRQPRPRKGREVLAEIRPGLCTSITHQAALPCM